MDTSPTATAEYPPVSPMNHYSTGVGSVKPPGGLSPRDIETENCNGYQRVSSDQKQSSDTKNDALMRTILIGTSNCRGLRLNEDESTVGENELLSQGG